MHHQSQRTDAMHDRVPCAVWMGASLSLHVCYWFTYIPRNTRMRAQSARVKARMFVRRYHPFFLRASTHMCLNTCIMSHHPSTLLESHPCVFVRITNCVPESFFHKEHADVLNDQRSTRACVRGCYVYGVPERSRSRVPRALSGGPSAWKHEHSSACVQTRNFPAANLRRLVMYILYIIYIHRTLC